MALTIVASEECWPGNAVLGFIIVKKTNTLLLLLQTIENMPKLPSKGAVHKNWYFIIHVPKEAVLNIKKSIFHYTCCKRSSSEHQQINISLYLLQKKQFRTSQTNIPCYLIHAYNRNMTEIIFVANEVVCNITIGTDAWFHESISWNYHGIIIVISWREIDIRPNGHEPINCQRIRVAMSTSVFNWIIIELS